MNPKGKLENLTPFRPGQSGNPGGRPRKRLISDCHADRAQMPLDESLRRELKLPKGLTWAEAIALRLAQAAVEGSPGAAREFREAVEGRSRQRVETDDSATGLEDLAERLAEARHRWRLARDSTSGSTLPPTERTEGRRVTETSCANDG